MPDLPTADSVPCTRLLMLLLGFITFSFEPPRFTVSVPFLAEAFPRFLSGEEDIAESPPFTTDMSCDWGREDLMDRFGDIEEDTTSYRLSTEPCLRFTGWARARESE
jgi:hypothetical protein